MVSVGIQNRPMAGFRLDHTQTVPMRAATLGGNQTLALRPEADVRFPTHGKHGYEAYTPTELTGGPNLALSHQLNAYALYNHQLHSIVACTAGRR